MRRETNHSGLVLGLLLIVLTGASAQTKAQAVSLHGQLPAGAPRTDGGDRLRLSHFRSVLMTFSMRRAVNDAARRLGEPECQRLLTDFTDQSGNLLSANLSRLAMTPVEFVERGLLFVDASDARPCLTDQRAAFTSPGSRVIFVCSSRLVSANSAPISKIALLIIHEALHALGLGENPPTSAQITRQVARRCAF